MPQQPCKDTINVYLVEIEIIDNDIISNCIKTFTNKNDSIKELKTSKTYNKYIQKL